MTKPSNPHHAEPIPQAAREEVERLLNTGDLFRYTAAEDAPVTLLEAEFAEMMGAKYALAVASCSSALFLSLKALNLPRGAKIAIPAFTFAAVPSSIVHADCTPLLIECGDDYRIDIDDLAAKIDQADAVMISHMRGHTSDMDAILKLAAARDLPVIEDAAHSLGTTWNGKTIGTLGRVGCFSFQSYKLLNAGEGGIMITDDAELIARAVIMSGAYEHNWKKHKVLAEPFARLQNTLPVYNTRLSNLSAALVRAQLPEVARRVTDGRRNHDHVAALLNQSAFLEVPNPLGPELRAPDSIQFNLCDMNETQIADFVIAAKERGVTVQVFGQSQDNARAYWNWKFLGALPELPKTRAMLMRACDVRLPARLTLDECSLIAAAITEAAASAMGQTRKVA